MAVSDAAGAMASLRLVGTGFTLVTARGSGMGIVEVRVEDVWFRRLDLYASSPRSGFERKIDGLSDGPHRATIGVTDTCRAAASGSAIAVDAWIVW